MSGVLTGREAPDAPEAWEGRRLNGILAGSVGAGLSRGDGAS